MNDFDFEAVFGGHLWDEHGFYIGDEEVSPTTSKPAERRDDGEVENDHYFEMRNELRGWE